MDRVLEYLNTGETLVLVGAGASRELGIPTWHELAAALVSRLPVALNTRAEEAERLLQDNKYPELCDWISRNAGKEFLYANCRELLKDTGVIGKINTFIARAPFKAVFTTNFDHSLERHFRAAGRATSTFMNTREDITVVDIDTLNCLVYLHSDLEHTETLILTEHQYVQARSGGKFDYLRQFITSYLASKRFLLIGYSLSDPDVQLLMEQLGQGLRRKLPILAILPDPLPEESARLKTIYNVEVMPYHNRSGNHSELIRLFEALSRFGEDLPPRRLDPNLDLKRAQSLYLWSRFGLSGDAPGAHVDALKSVVLSVLSDRSHTVDELQRSVHEIVGLAGPTLDVVVDRALAELQVDGHVVDDQGTLTLSSATAELATTATNQHARLRDSFIQQVELDLERLWPEVAPEDREKAAKLTLSTLVDIFDERGVELVNAVLGGAQVGGRRSPNLFALLSRTGAELGDDDLRYRFVTYMIDTLTNPPEAQRAYLEHLALAFFSLHALAMDPDGQQFRHEFLTGRTLLLDSNILIPLLPLRGAFQEDMAGLLALARQCGIPLLTTEGFVSELHRHGTWADELVRGHGANSVEVLAAARGEGFKRNAFLDGYVRYCVDEKSLAFGHYLKECVGGQEFTRENIARYLQSQHGVQLLEFQTIASTTQEAFSDRDETEGFIREQAEARQIDKSDSRIRAEAEAYTVVIHWPIPTNGATSHGSAPADVAVLSRGGYLNRVARSGPRPTDRRIVVTPDALYGFLLRTGSVPQSGLSFRELLVSPLFDTSAHFVHWEKYRKFFANLINDAERIFSEHLERFQAEIDATLKPEFYDEIEPLDRPYFTASLLSCVQNKESVAQRLARDREVEKLKKELQNAKSALGRKARKKQARRRKRKGR